VKFLFIMTLRYNRLSCRISALMVATKSLKKMNTVWVSEVQHGRHCYD
jgi:hypothetical protein